MFQTVFPTFTNVTLKKNKQYYTHKPKKKKIHIKLGGKKYLPSFLVTRFSPFTHILMPCSELPSELDF